jgi:hypothetical protein
MTSPATGYCRILTARAITSSKMAREAVACMVITALAQRASGEADYRPAAWSPCRASWSSFSSSLDREVFRTVPPYLLITATA